METIKNLCGLLAMLAITACSSNSDEAVGNDKQIWNVTLTASMDDADTRALSESGTAITASFAKNDEVVVVDADGTTIVGTLKAKSAGATTTLTGTLDAKSLADNEVVTLRYLSATANYDGQTGTLIGISTGQDYAEGNLTVSTISPLTFTSNSVTLKAKQSITKFTFTCGGDVSVETFGIAADGLVRSIAKNGTDTIGAVTGTLATASPNVYVALRNKSGSQQTYSFMVKDNANNWYRGTKKANLANGKNYAASVTLTKLPALTSSDAVGTIGVIGGLPAIVAEINSTKKAIALMNAGALCPEHYGNYYTFANLSSAISNGWYVPTKDELDALAAIETKSWGAQNGVNGYTFTIGSNTLFLPAAGYYDIDTGDGTPSPIWLNVSTFGHYWSSTPNSDDTYANSLSFSSSNINTYSEYKINTLSVRPFHGL